jgi:carbon monoxide dehydrogenase subunit G
VNGSFDVTADGSTAWAVLTDYDQMRHFITGLKRSHLEEYSGRGRFLVEQEFDGGFLFVTKRVRVSLAVCETRCQSILFEDVGHKDFEFYKGSWELRSEPNGQLKVTYALKAQQNFDEPFAGNYMRGGIQNLLDSVQREILRRQALVLVVPAT